MHAFVHGKIVETDQKIYQFSSESRAKEFLRYAYQQGEVCASSKVQPLTARAKHQASLLQRFLQDR